MSEFRKIAVIGGAGYVGSVLVPQLLKQGYAVRVLDLFLYGQESLADVQKHPKYEQIKGDVRDAEAVKSAVKGCDAVIHLACISNDPSAELDPALSESVNFKSFEPTVKISKDSGVRRFIFASSGSVYGVSDAPEVTEEHPLVPVSLYNKYKAMCEPVLLKNQSRDFVTVIIRPATICGYSPRQRLDLTVNILTNHAVNLGKITIFGGDQMRPNLHMQDMVDLYSLLLKVDDKLIAGQIFNAGYQNYSVTDIATMIRDVVAKEMPEKGKIELTTTPSDDPRSYRITSEKIKRVLNFTPKYTIQDGARDLVKAFRAGKLPNSLTDLKYFNVKLMKQAAMQ